MEVLDLNSAYRKLCKDANKFGMYFSITILSTVAEEEIFEKAPWLKEHMNMIIEECGFILFDSEEECFKIFEQTECDNHDNKVSIYAYVINDQGIIITENT